MLTNLGANGLLEDLRNFKNFRSTQDEFFDPSDSASFGLAGRTAGTSPSKSFYMSAKDFLFSESLNLVDTAINIPEIQPIILNEFQPDNQYYWLQRLGTAAFHKAWNAMGKSESKAVNVLNSMFSGNLGKTLVRWFKECDTQFNGCTIFY